MCDELVQNLITAAREWRIFEGEVVEHGLKDAGRHYRVYRALHDAIVAIDEREANRKEGTDA